MQHLHETEPRDYSDLASGRVCITKRSNCLSRQAGQRDFPESTRLPQGQRDHWTHRGLRSLLWQRVSANDVGFSARSTLVQDSGFGC